MPRKRSRGRGARSGARGRYAAESLTPLCRQIRCPVDPPPVKEQLVSQRWVRVEFQAKDSGLHSFTTAFILVNLFQGADAGRSTAVFHRLRLYGPQRVGVADQHTPTISVNVALRPGIPKGSGSFPFQKFVDSGMSGSARSSIAVELSRSWNIFPLSHQDDFVLFEITDMVGAGANYHVDVFATVSYAPEISTVHIF